MLLLKSFQNSLHNGFPEKLRFVFYPVPAAINTKSLHSLLFSITENLLVLLNWSSYMQSASQIISGDLTANLENHTDSWNTTKGSFLTEQRKPDCNCLAILLLLYWQLSLLTTPVLRFATSFAEATDVEESFGGRRAQWHNVIRASGR